MLNKAKGSFPFITSGSSNSYLIRQSDPQVLLVHPQLKHLFEQISNDSEGKSFPLNSLSIIKNNSKTSYYKRYLKFLKENSFFELPTKQPFPKDYYTADMVRSSLANTDTIVYETTSFCPMDCFYCGYGEFYKVHSLRKEQNLSIEIAKNVMDYVHDLKRSALNRRNFRKLTIAFYGGEPLSNFDFIEEMVNYALSKTWPHNDIGFRMTTNGALLNRYMDVLVKHKFDLVISLDGNEQHNGYRVFKDGSPTFSIVMNNVLKLKAKYPEHFDRNVAFNTVIHSKNSVNDTLDFFKKSFGKIPRFSEVSPIDVNPHKESVFNTVYRKINEAQKPENVGNTNDIPNRLDLYKFLLSQTGYMTQKYSQLLEDDTLPPVPVRTGTCLPFKNKIFCTADGKLLACERIPWDYVLGSADERGVYIDFQTVADKYNGWYNKIRSQCSRCYDSSYCSKCMFYIDLLSETPSCSNFKDETAFIKDLQKNLSHFETKPGIYLNLIKRTGLQPSDQFNENRKTNKKNANHSYSHWLFLHPYTLLNVKKNHAVIYNSLTGKLLEYKQDKTVLNLLKQLSMDENLYVVGLKPGFSPRVKKLIRDIRNTFSGDIIPYQKGKPKPFQFKPILHFDTSLVERAFSSKIKLLDGDEITDYLESLNIYINNRCSRNCSFCSTAYKQFLCCTSRKGKSDELSVEAIKSLLTQVEKTKLKQINILGGNIFEHSEFETLVELLNKSRFAIHYYIHLSNLSEETHHKQLINLLIKDKNNVLHLLIPPSFDRASMIRLANQLKSNLIHTYFHFIVEKKGDLACILFDEKLGIEDHSVIVSFYNGKNLNFFKKYVFVSKSALSESRPSLKETFARATLNVNDFAKLTVMSDSKVYANVNNPALEKLSKASIIDIIKKEMIYGRSWGKIRKNVKPCSGCAYNTICPPISGYKYSIGRYDCCDI